MGNRVHEDGKKYANYIRCQYFRNAKALYKRMQKSATALGSVNGEDRYCRDHLRIDAALSVRVWLSVWRNRIKYLKVRIRVTDKA